MNFQSDQPNKPDRRDRPNEQASVGRAQWKINLAPSLKDYEQAWRGYQLYWPLVTSVEKGDNAPMSHARNRSAQPPRCIVIAGPNGAGKTTFAREFLPREGGIIRFVNADLIASGLSPLRPELAARRGGRLVLTELSRLAKARQDFAFESTLSGRTYLPLLRRWKTGGYRIELVFLSLPSVELAFQRIAARVRQGGHDVPRADVVRRFDRSWKNFHLLYRELADTWAIYDNAGETPRLLGEGP